MITITPRAIAKLQELQSDAAEGRVFRVCLKGLG